MTGQWGEFFAIDKNKGIIYAGHEHTGCLYRFDTNGKKLSSIAYPTKESNYYLGDGAIDTNANIYLCGETLPSYTYKYNASSKKWSVLGSTVRPLTWPFAVTINKSGNLAVLDVSQQIKMYDTNGKLLKNIAIATPDFGGCLAADFSGNMYHTQFGVFSRFDSGGKKTKQRSGSNYYGIEALTADSKNRLYAISDYGFSIARLNQNGDFLAETPVSTIIKDKFLSDLSGIAVDTEFNIYIADGKEGILSLTRIIM